MSFSGLTGKTCELLNVKTAQRSNYVKNNNSKEELQSIERIARIILNNSIYSSTREQEYINSLTDAEKCYYRQNVTINKDDALQLCIKTRYQNNYLWQHERKKRITASNAYSFYTYLTSSKRSIAEWETKMDKHLNSTFKGTADTKHGLLMEEAAIECYERCTDFQITKMGLLINPSVSWFGYSPDGVVEKKLIIEIKSPKVGKTTTAIEAIHCLAYLIVDSDGNIYLKEKHQYFCQVQLGMFVTGLLFCHFIIYCSYDDLCCIVEVPYNEKLIVKYLVALEKIYFEIFLKAIVSNDEGKENSSNN